ncbi:hypothetical protein LROSL1_2099 [Furfurilactobacillus rossiae]|nr:hypothetical protein LROSL1_2099 [Furfurilactobacillus rossiae]
MQAVKVVLIGRFQAQFTARDGREDVVFGFTAK